jgi:hypothetical protein
MHIGLIGYAGSGKSTVADILCREYGYVRRPFAYTLKAMAVTLGIPVEIVEGDAEAKAKPLDILGGRTARHAMQTLGTEWGRMCMGENFWVDRWKAGAPKDNPLVVVDDVRFHNEVKAIHDLGGIIVRIERPGIVPGSHASEQIESLEFDHRIVNDGTKDDLRYHLNVIMEIEADHPRGDRIAWLKQGPDFFEKYADEDAEVVA